MNTTTVGPTGSRSDLAFSKLYEMSRSKQMEWGIAREPFYYHSAACDHKCGGGCMGCEGSRIAEDAADIVRSGWKPQEGGHHGN